MKRKDIKQGDIYIANFDGIENEEQGIRPCVCLSCNTLTRNRKNVIIAPITSSTTKKNMINHYILSKKDYPFFKYNKNTILLECIRDISKTRLERSIGQIKEEDLNNILETIMYDFIEKNNS